MKRISIIALVLVCVTAIAFKVNSTITMRSKGQPNVSASSTFVHLSAANSGKDTMVGSGSVHRDTGYVWAYIPENNDMTVDLLVTQLTGSITACTQVLQGAYDTGSNFFTADWETITGVTTYCAGCVGASSTTVPGASKHYKWFVPHSTHTWKFVRVQADMTGTFTATYTGKLTSEY